MTLSTRKACQHPSRTALEPKPGLCVGVWWWLAIVAVTAALAFVLFVASGCVKSSAKSTAPMATGTRQVTQEFMHPDGTKETRTTTSSATATGTGAAASGDDVKQTQQSEPAQVSVNDHVVATGGGGSTKISAETESTIMFWLLGGSGILCILGAGAAFYFNLKKLAIIALITGMFLIAAAIYPMLLVGVVAILIVGGGFYAWDAWKRQRDHEALRATTAAIQLAPPEARDSVKAELVKQADDRDFKTIRSVIKSDDLPTIGAST